MIKLESKAPQGPLAEKWSKHKAEIKVVSPANKRKLDIIVIGTGLGGASAAASLGELGYNVKVFCISDSPRRAHSIAAQGGINAAKNYQNDNDSVFRLFYDTIKGGDYRAREANVYRLAEVCATRSSTSASLRAFRSPASTADCSTNRSFGGVTGIAYVLCPGSDRTAAAAGRLCQALEPSDRRRNRQELSPPRDARAGHGRRQGSGYHHAQSGDGRDRDVSALMRSSWLRADTATSSSCRPTR